MSAITQTCIVNNDETIVIPLKIIQWHETQKSTPAIRDVPTALTGQYLDVETYVIECRKIDFSARFTENYKNNINSIYAEAKLVTVYLLDESGNTGWKFIGWLREKNITWDYDNTDHTDSVGSRSRVWLIALKLDISEFTYYSDFPNRVVG